MLFFLGGWGGGWVFVIFGGGGGVGKLPVLSVPARQLNIEMSNPCSLLTFWVGGLVRKKELYT